MNREFNGSLIRYLSVSKRMQLSKQLRLTETQVLPRISTITTTNETTKY